MLLGGLLTEQSRDSPEKRTKIKRWITSIQVNENTKLIRYPEYGSSMSMKHLRFCVSFNAACRSLHACQLRRNWLGKKLKIRYSKKGNDSRADRWPVRDLSASWLSEWLRFKVCVLDDPFLFCPDRKLRIGEWHICNDPNDNLAGENSCAGQQNVELNWTNQGERINMCSAQSV